MRQALLGPEHPDTLGSMKNLAEMLRSQGKYGADAGAEIESVRPEAPFYRALFKVPFKHDL
jgi:hypothetical protein